MEFQELAIAGVYHCTIQPHVDSRGSFSRLFCAEKFRANGLHDRWVQTNLSRTLSRGAIRGMHFQTAPFAETKLLTCLTGRIFDVLVDVRPHSPTFGRWTSIELNALAASTLYIPEGIAHGFQTLTDDVTLHYSHSAPFQPDHQAGLCYNDTDVAVDWPLPVTILSDRDRDLPTFTDLQEVL